MRRRLHSLLVVASALLILVAFAGEALAQKTVHVRGYTRKDGTVVKPYDRKAPEKKGSSVTPATSGTAGGTTLARPTTLVRADLVVYMIDGGVIFHRKDCDSITGHKLVPVRYADLPATAEECTRCRPLAAPDAAPIAAPATPATRAGAAHDQAKKAPDDNGDTLVYITKTAKKYHTDGCRSLSKSRIPIKLRDAVTRGYTACSICKPPALKAGQEAAGPSTAVPPAPAARSAAPQDNGDVTVYITRTGAKYHQAGCRSLARSSIPIKLRDTVAKGYGACSLCNPPTLTKR